ncbi:unnamed protein product [Prunus armeniaca]
MTPPFHVAEVFTGAPGKYVELKESITSFQFSFNYSWIFAISLAFNLTNLKNRGYPYEGLGRQEKSRTTQEQGNSKLDTARYEALLKNGDQVTSVLEEMITLIGCREIGEEGNDG